jgi:hypothetical protein
MDSDNFASIEYFNAWNKFMKSTIFDINTNCFLPIKLKTTSFNYDMFLDKPINFNNLTYYGKYNLFRVLMNTGNYIFPKKLYCDSIASPELAHLEEKCYSMDVFLRNYLLLRNGAVFNVVKDMEYEHIVHPGSFYINTHTLIN